MATTRLIKYHAAKGQTMAEYMKDRFDYGRNPLKTRDGELTAAYMCDSKNAEAEFVLSKEKYKAATGREQKKESDVLFYQIRQSFMRGETDAEAALKIGYDLGMRWTKGKHAFFVVSHIDRPHPHVHIYYNSTTLDYARKFRNFLGSSLALRRLSDRICIENDLSIITNPKLKSKGKFKHYGQWLGADRQPTFQERLKTQIDVCLAGDPGSFDEFLREMEAAGYEVKYGRGGVVSFRTEGQERFTRLRASTLGDGYGQEDIRAAIEGRVTSSGGRAAAPEGRSADPPRKVSLIIDIQSRMKAGKGPGYEQWAKVFNLKQMAAAVQYLHENNLFSYEDLAAKAEAAADRFHTVSDTLRQTEAAMKRNAGLKAAIVDYARTRPVFNEYRAKKYSNKYLAAHEADIATYRAAQATMKELLQGAKLPKMAALKAEWQALSAAKKSGYAEYRAAKKDMRDVVTVKANSDHLLGLTDRQKSKEVER